VPLDSTFKSVVHLVGTHINVPICNIFLFTELGRCTPEKTFIFVNRRPVEFRPLEKLLQCVFSEAAGLEPTAAKFPVSVVSLELGACSARAGLDPNLEPNKQRVGLACCAALLAGLERHLRQLYGLRSLEDGGPIAAEEEELNDSYGRLLQRDSKAEACDNFGRDGPEKDILRPRGETCRMKTPPADLASKRTNSKGSCFTMIGQTQEDDAGIAVETSGFFEGGSMHGDAEGSVPSVGKENVSSEVLEVLPIRKVTHHFIGKDSD